MGGHGVSPGQWGLWGLAPVLCPMLHPCPTLYPCPMLHPCLQTGST